MNAKPGRAPYRSVLNSGGFPVFAVGDSLALHLKKYNFLSGDAVAGRTPQAVLDSINETLHGSRGNLDAYRGRDVILANGTNGHHDAKTLELVRQQIKTLQCAGATVVLVGVGSGPRNILKDSNINGQLATIAYQEKVGFTGPLDEAGLWDREKEHLNPTANRTLFKHIEKLFAQAHAAPLPANPASCPLPRANREMAAGP